MVICLMISSLEAVDTGHMRRALALARRAARLGEVPVGAVLVDEVGRLLATEHNRSILACDPTAHAEVLCLRTAAAALGNYRLTGTTLYVSLEPCLMCAGALVWARVRRVVFAASDVKAGMFGSVLDMAALHGLNHRLLVQGGLLAAESAEILTGFFVSRR
ncbi:tRNA-specific adenosine deaminase [Desulfarculales bacterium]